MAGGVPAGAAAACRTSPSVAVSRRPEQEGAVLPAPEGGEDEVAPAWRARSRTPRTRTGSGGGTGSTTGRPRRRPAPATARGTPAARGAAEPACPRRRRASAGRGHASEPSAAVAQARNATQQRICPGFTARAAGLRPRPGTWRGTSPAAAGPRSGRPGSGRPPRPVAWRSCRGRRRGRPRAGPPLPVAQREAQVLLLRLLT